jgi:tripartite ATP-independent transporter DctP family solute receptor
MFDRRRILKTGAAATAALMAGTIGRSSFGQAPQQTFKLAFPDNAAHPSAKVAQRFAATLAERTKGRFKIDVFPGGTLGSETNIVAGLQTGIVDFTMHTAGYVSSYIPTVGALDIPFMFKDKATGQRVVAGEVGKQLQNDGLQRNIVILGWSQNGWRNIETVGKVIKSPADLKDLKIRIQAGPIFAAMFKAVGAVPVVIDASDLYVALQQKTIDGLEIPLPSTISFKTYEIAKNIAMSRHVYNACLFMASKPKLDAMAPADRDIVRATGAEAAAQWFELMGEEDDKALKFSREHGCEVTEINYAEFRNAMAPVYDVARARFGPLVQKLLDATA